MNAARVAVDCRMLFHSGIGRYLREILSRAETGGAWQWVFLVGDQRSAAWLRERFPSAEQRAIRARIYTLREQFAVAWAARDCALLWVPHYNVPLLRRRGLVTTVHDVAHRALPDIFGSWLMQGYTRAVMHRLVRTATRVICVSQFTRTELVRWFGAPSGSAEVIWNGATRLPRDTAMVPPAGPYLLFLGNLKPHKNLGRLFEAFARAAPEDWRLVVAGQVNHTYAVADAELLQRLKGSPRCTVVDSPNDATVGALLAGSAGLVFPSLYEGFGLPVAESFLAGKPVIAARLPSLEEVYGSDDAAVIWCDPESIESIAASIAFFAGLSPGDHARRAEHGQRCAARLSWQTTAERTVACLRAALQEVTT